MKNIMHLFILSLLLICVGNSCSRQAATLGPFKWQAIHPYIDSLTLQAELLWVRNNSLDSIRRTIDEMELIAPRLKGENGRDALARFHYWNARLLRRLSRNEDMEKELNLALQFCDSLRDPYSYGRIMELRYLSENPYSEEFFKFLLSRLEYYQEIGDITQEANIAIHISNSLGDFYQPYISLAYLNLADSLYSKLGFTPYMLGTRINEASLLHASGNSDSARIMLDELIDDKFVNSHPIYLELVLRNYYTFFKDSVSLFRGYELIRPKRRCSDGFEIDTIPSGTSHIRSFYEALICKYFLQINNIDSATRYFKFSQRHLRELQSQQQRMLVYEIYSSFCEMTEHPKEALSYMKAALSLNDSIYYTEQPLKKVYLENINTLKIKEIESNNAQRRLKLTYYLIIAVMLIVLAVIVIFFQHRRQIQKTKAVQTQLELERGQRKLLALSLSKEESNKILDYIKEEIGRMGRDGNISTSDISQIERNLKLHFAGQNERESFENTFENVNPEFIKRLKEVSPSISENNIRLCSYILIGLSNHQIADLMHVRIASVKQSRWRLRTRLGLASDQSLEDYLRSLQT